MHRYSSILISLVAALGITSAVPAFAESAPVYDVDAMQDSYDAADDSQDLPPPPPPESGFVPAQNYGQGDSAPAPSRRSSMSGSGGTSAVDQRIKRMEEEIKNLRGSESNARAEALQNEVQILRNQVEQLTHQLEQIQTQPDAAASSESRDGLIADTTSRNEDDSVAAAPKPKGVKASASKASAKAGAIAADTKEPVPTAKPITTVENDTKPSTGDQPNVAEEQQIYQSAYNLIKEKKYSEAAGVLQDMLKKYPSGQFASNAHYWLGELYVLMDKNDLALKEFGTVVEDYAKSPRVSDAQLKIGIIYAAQANWTNAKDSFKKVINHYPGTASSRVASEQLKQIKQAGH